MTCLHDIHRSGSDISLLWTDRGYPKKLAYQYLEDLHQEFSRQYGQQVETAARPYAFIKFGKRHAIMLGNSGLRFHNSLLYGNKS